MARKLLLCTLIIIALVSPACARVQRFGHFRADIPAGWTGELQGSTLVIKSDYVNASLAVAFAEMGEASLTDIVERLYIQMKGQNLEQDEDGDYMFTFTNLAGAESMAIVMGEDGYYLVLSMTGYDNEEVQDEMMQIMDSIDYDD